MIYQNEGIAFSKRTGAGYIIEGASAPPANILPANYKLSGDGRQITVAPPSRFTTTVTPWSPWGDGNDLPQQIAKDMEECGVLNAAHDAKARIAVGKGVQPFLLVNVDKDGKEDLEWISDSEIHDWLELNDSFGYSLDSVYNQCAYGFPVSQMILSRDRKKINRIKATDTASVRLAKRDPISGTVDKIFLCDDWSLAAGASSAYVREVAALEEGNELQDLLTRTDTYEYSMFTRHLRNGRSDYPRPLHLSAKQWVNQAKAIPILKNAAMKNQITVKYLITISAGYWKRIHQKWDSYTPSQRQQIMDEKLAEIDQYLAGGENQFKSITTTSFIDPITKQEIPDIRIDVLDDKMKEGKNLQDSAAANSEVLFAICVNPALVGAGQPGGPYSQNAGGSNIREAYLTQIMLLERERQDNARIFNLVKNYNGWAKRLEVERPRVISAGAGDASTGTPTIKPRLVFRYPANVLTTLDTGKSTRGEVV